MYKIKGMSPSPKKKQLHPSPLFFIGCSPSQAQTIINPQAPAAGTMINVTQLRKRKTDFAVGDWILDSGAFTEVSRYGDYRYSVEEYFNQILRWSQCGNLLIAVSQDWMCEPFVLERTGKSIQEHQDLTIERFEYLSCCYPPVPIMPVLQGWDVSDYLYHLQQYGTRLTFGAWVGVGSICRRNGNPQFIKDVLKGINLFRPDLRLHGFGLKQLALENAEVRSLLYSCDSMAWSYPRRFQKEIQPEIDLAHEYQQKINAALTDNVQKRTPLTAGAGNGQGRKPIWKSGKTKAIRVPEQFADKLLELARELDEQATR